MQAENWSPSCRIGNGPNKQPIEPSPERAREVVPKEAVEAPGAAVNAGRHVLPRWSRSWAAIYILLLVYHISLKISGLKCSAQASQGV